MSMILEDSIRRKPNPTIEPLTIKEFSWGAITFLSAVGMPSIFLLTQVETWRVPPNTLAVTCVILLWSSLHLAFLVATGRSRITTLTVWLFIYISGAVVPLAQARTGLYPWIEDINLIPTAQ